MGFWQRAWRKQKAVNRARNIRRFRKGRPKLGCYKCWYDCYEVEGERCPECNAAIDRGAPWWKDGALTIRSLTLYALLAGAIGVSSYVTRWFLESPSMWYYITQAATILIMYIAVGVLAVKSVKHSRLRESQARRLVLVVMVLMAPILITGYIDIWMRPY